MSCHFSPYGTGLSCIPRTLPPGSVLMLADRTPMAGHDPHRIATQLTQAVQHLGCSAVVLDLQRENPEADGVVDAVLQALPCPVIVSELYAKERDCAVLVSAPQLWTPLEEHLRPWAGRSIWLEAVTDSALVTVTETGSRYETTDLVQDTAFTDETLHLHYSCRTLEDHAAFYLHRDHAQLEALLNKAKLLGVTEFLGLYQQIAL